MDISDIDELNSSNPNDNTPSKHYYLKRNNQSDETKSKSKDNISNMPPGGRLLDLHKALKFRKKKTTTTTNIKATANKSHTHKYKRKHGIETEPFTNNNDNDNDNIIINDKNNIDNDNSNHKNKNSPGLIELLDPKKNTLNETNTHGTIFEQTDKNNNDSNNNNETNDNDKDNDNDNDNNIEKIRKEPSESSIFDKKKMKETAKNLKNESKFKSYLRTVVGIYSNVTLWVSVWNLLCSFYPTATKWEWHKLIIPSYLSEFELYLIFWICGTLCLQWVGTFYEMAGYAGTYRNEQFYLKCAFVKVMIAMFADMLMWVGIFEIMVPCWVDSYGFKAGFL